MTQTEYQTLLTLAHVHALPFERVRLTLNDGQAVTVDLEDAPRALLCPLPGGAALLLEDWKDAQARAYRVPADLCPALRAAFFLRRVGA